MRFRLSSSIMALTCCSLVAANALWAAPAAGDPYRPINDGWERFGSVYGRIIDDYYDSLGQGDVMRAAIDGMLTKLDPYSQFYDREGLRQLRQDTSGRFAGLGITVGLKDHYPLVIATIPETPAAAAALAPGDRITAVDGVDTRDWALDRVVTALRGDPGSRVRLTVLHPATVPRSRELSLARELIRLHSVSQACTVAPGIGYISLRQTRFSEETAAEVERALAQLQPAELQGLILDLRGNPGGLLTQATAVASLFLPNGAPIVSIRERDGRRTETKYAQGQPIPAPTALALLVDGGSASASEIVAGAIQDNDRGVIVGTTTYGKGSVQTVFDLIDDTSALKLTTARYYTPSGRSIHREPPPATQAFHPQLVAGNAALPALPVLGLVAAARTPGQALAGLRTRFDLNPTEALMVLNSPLAALFGWSPDSLTAARPDSAAAASYQTASGRPVQGGGGITPDLVVGDAPEAPFVVELERRRAFFDFVVDLVAADSLTAAVLDTSGDSSALTARFLDYPTTRSVLTETQERARAHLQALRALTLPMGWDSTVAHPAAQLDAALLSVQATVLAPELRQALASRLHRDLRQRLHPSPAPEPVEPSKDPVLQAAVDLLRDAPRLAQTLRRPGP